MPIPTPLASALSTAVNSNAEMLSIARQARGPCRREAVAARAGRATAPAVSARQHTAAGLHLLRLLPRAGAPSTSSAGPPSHARSRRDRFSSGVAGANSRARRALTSSPTIRGADGTGVGGQLEGLRGGAAVGGTPEEWEAGHELHDCGTAFGLPEFSDNSEGGDDFLPRTQQAEEERENASDAEEGDGGQAAAEAEREADEVLQSQIKDPSMMRLSRRIARSGIASRREAERLVEAGVVTVNGTPVQTPALNVGPRDIVKVKVGFWFLCRSTVAVG